jgi:16S rRNA (adenine1518-N6/adenine1519-N6)-dimethyltransferase
MDTPQLKQRLARYGLTPDKRLGQHFLCHLPTLAKIADAVGTASNVLEIGPGPGVLTAFLAQQPGRKLTLIEKDQRLEPLLLDCFPTAQVIMDDALTADWSAFGQHTFVSNLPYNVSVPIMLRYIQASCQNGAQTDARADNQADIQTDSCTGSLPKNQVGPGIFMMQKEVAARLCATPSSKAYGRLSVMAQMYVKPRLITHVPPSAFWPMPGVHSSVLALCPDPSYHHVPFAVLEHVVAAAFASRRKMLHHNLHALGWTLEDGEHLGIDLRRRAEELSIQEFASLALCYAAKKTNKKTLANQTKIEKNQ